MANQPNTVDDERDQESPRSQPTDRNEARKALMRLRRIGEGLPPVDAAALVREGRVSEHNRGAS
jgi:hypothetical protein